MKSQSPIKNRSFKKAILIPLVYFATNFSYADNITESKLSAAFNTEYGHMFQSDVPKSNPVSQNKKNGALGGAASLLYNASRATDTGVNYGLQLTLLSSFNQSGGASVNGSHIFIERGDFGKFEIGAPYSAARKMHVSMANVDEGTTLDWTDYAKLNPGNIKGINFRAGHSLMTDGSTKGVTNEATRKVSYYTPSIEGLQIGMSYVPDTSNTGTSVLDSKALEKRKIGITGLGEDFIRIRDLFTYGVAYKANIQDGMDVNVAFTGEYAKNVISKEGALPDEKLKPVKTYNIGAHVTYGNFGVAGSYQHLGESLSAKAYDLDKMKTHAYTFGVSYKEGPAAGSVTYFNSDLRGNKLQAVSLAVSYSEIPGLKPYIELTRYNAKGRYLDSAKNIKRQKADGFALVMGVSFNIDIIDTKASKA